MKQNNRNSDDVEDGGFVIEEPEDEFALEELVYGSLSKCRGRGEGKRDKFRVPQSSQNK